MKSFFKTLCQVEAICLGVVLLLWGIIWGIYKVMEWISNLPDYFQFPCAMLILVFMVGICVTMFVEDIK